MKILITGANGFIGSYFLEFFSKKNYDVVGIIRNEENITAKYRYIVCDLEDELNIEKDFDIIIHCAAELDKYTENMEKYVRGNIIVTQNVLNYARRHHIKKIINLNSVRYFGKSQEKIISESTPIFAPGNYGITKAVAEKMLLDSDIATISLILPGVIGKNGHTPWLMRVARDFLENKLVYCYDPDAKFNNVVHINTLARNVEKLLYFNIEKNENILLGCRNLMSKYDVLCFMKRGLSSQSIIRIIDSKDTSFYLNIEKAKKMKLYLPTIETEIGQLIQELKVDAESRKY